MISIDKDIPIPKHHHQTPSSGWNGAGRPPIYPIKNMEVGDSFFIKDKKPTSVRDYLRVKGHVLNVKFIVRVENDGVRVWRVK